MLELVKAGGWLMVPILLCSVAAMAIVAERFWTLQQERVAPDNLVVQAWQWARAGEISEQRLRNLRDPPLRVAARWSLGLPARRSP